ncbi:hypothetical protein Glove_21g266 [Diversispora epigaea]|uniref:Galactose oxidase n=1 Tax=Diversispora epigaea TaxID=1348612 RepID=A0A397JPT8_9GLOM|nr:hypothetical protein Glove_21g266 [Diversispora epigaea]
MKIIKLNIEYFIYFLIISQLWIISIYSFQSPNLFGHSTTLLDKKLYFIGGYELTTEDNSSFFYIDLNQSFNVSTPAFVPLESAPVGIIYATACVGGANNATIFVFGGINQDKNSKSQIMDKLINKFDTTSQEWSTPQIKGEPIRRRGLQAVIDTKGNMYLFGGFYHFGNSSTPTFFEDMIIFNTITLAYSNGSTIDGPPRMRGYSATLLSNGIIMYIGGVGAIVIPIINITMYDINEDSWSSTIAESPNDIQDRGFHSAVLAPNGLIICYGGASLKYYEVSPSLIVLNTTSFEWRSPEHFGTNQPPNLYTHSANLVENYMIIGFGNVTDGDSYSLSTSSSIYILDINNYTWISYYEALPIPPPQNVTDPPPLSVGAIVGITISVAIVMVLLLFFGIRYYRNRTPNFYVSGSQK